jgi:hypothetical protein
MALRIVNHIMMTVTLNIVVHKISAEETPTPMAAFLEKVNDATAAGLELMIMICLASVAKVGPTIVRPKIEKKNRGHDFAIGDLSTRKIPTEERLRGIEQSPKYL